jgi:hypothetical protein
VVSDSPSSTAMMREDRKTTYKIYSIDGKYSQSSKSYPGSQHLLISLSSLHSHTSFFFVFQNLMKTAVKQERKTKKTHLVHENIFHVTSSFLQFARSPPNTVKFPLFPGLSERLCFNTALSSAWLRRLRRAAAGKTDMQTESVKNKTWRE